MHVNTCILKWETLTYYLKGIHELDTLSIWYCVWYVHLGQWIWGRKDRTTTRTSDHHVTACRGKGNGLWTGGGKCTSVSFFEIHS